MADTRITEARGVSQGVHGERLLTDVEAADLLALRPATLRRWRLRGVGPRWAKLGSAVRYAAADLEAYVAASGRTSTSDRGPADAA